MAKVKALVLTGYGLNCDHETAYAFELAGAEARRVHINLLIDGSVNLDAFQVLAFIGGFSWGDDHGAGVVQAVRLKTHIGDKLLHFIERGNLVIGICNGFQAIVNLGLLPGFDGDYQCRSLALIANDCGNFQDRWVPLKTNPASPCVFTRHIDRIELPVRHGEGKFYAGDEILNRLTGNNQIALTYADPDGQPANGRFPYNPNGSVNDIAGICDATGRVFGLMPHPEAFNHFTNHPDWPRLKEHARRTGQTFDDDGITPGIRMFKNAVYYLQDRPDQ